MTDSSPFRLFVREALLRLAFGYLYLLLFSLSWYCLNGCSNDKPAPLSETIRNVWNAQAVRENNILVYTKGATANVRNYVSFQLDLSIPPTAKLTDFDGNTFVGTYTLQGDTKLILSNLLPQPTGSGGILAFTINSATASTLDVSRTTASAKTGGTVNHYQLTSN